LPTIFGAGATGLALAARLARVGLPVRVCTRRAEQARALVAHGLELEEPDRGTRCTLRVDARVGPPADTRGPLLVCVREPDAGPVAEAIASASPAANVVNVQNGVGGDARFAAAGLRVAAAVLRQTCTRHAEHRVRAQGGGRVVLGVVSPGTEPVVDAVASLLGKAGYDVGISTHVASDRWLKLCVNLMSIPNALVRRTDHETPAFTEGKARLLEEARDVLVAAGIAAISCDGRDRSLDDEIAWQRGALARGVAARPLPLYNAVWQGLHRDAPIEADLHHGAIVALGHRHGIPTPLNERMLAVLARVVREHLRPEALAVGELFGSVA
jgi:2-dehydropantoate 2-reductase